MKPLNDALKPCPHCQQTCVRACERKAKTSGGVHYFVRCGSCNSEGPRSLRSKEEAISKWNTRASTDARAASFVEWRKDNEKYVEPADYWAWIEEAFNAGLANTPASSAAQPAQAETSKMKEVLRIIADLPIDFCSTDNDYRLAVAKALALGSIDATAQHSDDIAVDRFAHALKNKLAKARENGRMGWEQCPPDDLSAMLREHVDKGDPRDVANFCMFLWHQGEPIAAPPILHLTDARLLSAFNSAESVIDGLHEVRALLASTAQAKPDHIGDANEMIVDKTGSITSAHLCRYPHCQRGTSSNTPCGCALAAKKG